MNIEEARAHLFAHASNGTVCPCCDRYFKTWKRKLNATMARGLCIFYLNAAKNGITRFYHVKEISDPWFQRYCIGGDFAKLRHWNMIEERVKDPSEDKRSSGFWRITEEGIAFARGRAKAKKYIWFLKNRPMDLPVELVEIRQCLKDPFSWFELMEATLGDDQRQINLFGGGHA